MFGTSRLRERQAQAVRCKGQETAAAGCDLTFATLGPSSPKREETCCPEWALAWSAQVQRWAIAEGLDSIEDVAFAFTRQEEADGALGEEGFALWTQARCGRFNGLLA